MLLLVTVSVVYSGCFRFVGLFWCCLKVLIGWCLAVRLSVLAVCFFGAYGGVAGFVSCCCLWIC